MIFIELIYLMERLNYSRKTVINQVGFDNNPAELYYEPKYRLIIDSTNNKDLIIYNILNHSLSNKISTYLHSAHRTQIISNQNAFLIRYGLLMLEPDEISMSRYGFEIIELSQFSSLSR